MGMHTYIGARYVPRFMGTYDATQIYDALDVVDNGSGTSYIARKTVPAGTPLTDMDHWFVYGASSGAIIALQNDMIAAQNDILALQGDVNTLNIDVPELKKAILPLNNKNMRLVVYTDSYGTSAAEGTPFTQQLDTRLNLSSGNYFSFERGSIGISPNGAWPAGMLGFLQDTEASVTDHDTITDILFALGCNDINNLGTIASDFASVVSYARTQYKNAKIHIAFIGNTTSYSVTQVNAAYEAYKSNAYANKCYFLEGADLIMRLIGNRKSDGIHPSSAGSDELAKFLAYGVINGTCDYHHNGTCSFVVGTRTINCRYRVVSSGLMSFEAPGETLTGAVPAFSTSFVDFALTNPPIIGNGYLVGIATAGNGSVNGGVTLDMTMNNSKIYFKSANGSFTPTYLSIPTATFDLRVIA